MSAEEGNLVGKLSALVDWDDGEAAATAGFPIDGDVVGIDLVDMYVSFFFYNESFAVAGSAH